MTDKSYVQTFLDDYKRDHQHPINQLSHVIGVPLIFISLAVMFFNLVVGIGLFVLAWIIQFIGHAFEGKAPSLVRNPKFLLGGPVWLADRAMALVRRRKGA
jgi:uncharacterized membrane protein YGL010W